MDGRTDLWALGATMFSLLSGKFVHEGETGSEICALAATRPARPLGEVAPEVPEAVRELIDRALMFAREERWASAGAMNEALREACERELGKPLAKLPRVRGMRAEESEGTEGLATESPSVSTVGASRAYIDGRRGQVERPRTLEEVERISDAKPIAAAETAGVVHRVADHFVAATWRSVGILIWRNETRPVDVSFGSEMLEDLAKSYPEGIGLFQFLEDACKELTSESHAALAKLLRTGRPYIRCSTVVFNGVGFRAAAAHAVATGLFWLARPGFPHAAFADPLKAAFVHAEHFRGRTQRTKFASSLVQVVQETRATTAVAPAYRRA